MEQNRVLQQQSGFRLSQWVTWLACSLILLAINIQGQFPFQLGEQVSTTSKEPVVKVTTYWSQDGMHPGGQIALAVVLDIRKPYHINAANAAAPYIPTKLELIEAPDFVRASTPLFPEAHPFEFGEEGAKELIQVYSDRTILYVPIAVTANAPVGEHTLKFQLRYQACDDKQCLLPAKVNQEVTLKVVPQSTALQPLHPDVFQGMQQITEKLSFAFFGWDFNVETSRLWLLLLLAGLGGLLLNFTPCVLPLIPIKIMSLSKSAGNRQRCLLLGLTMSAGVVAFWLGLGLAIMTISGFNATNKLFQYPAFTIGVGVIITIMAIGMCGLFSVQLPQWVYRINPTQESIGGSILFGIMTAILSTPCTAPFMGAAAAWSTTQPPAVTLSTFAAIGIGMALPYALLSAFPNLVNRMPRTGPASNLIKQVMGLLMLAAGAYFWGTGLAGLMAQPPDPPTQAFWWVVAGFVGVAGLWLAWRTFQIARRPVNRFGFASLGVVLVVLAVLMGVRFTQNSPINWVYYTPERLAAAKADGKVVVLEFTAAWCLNCHFLERTVLHDPKVVAQLNQKEIAPIKVDITGNNEAGNQKLVEVGRRTIPYLIIYDRKGQEVFSSDAYTIQQVLDALEKAAQS